MGPQNTTGLFHPDGLLVFPSACAYKTCTISMTTKTDTVSPMRRTGKKLSVCQEVKFQTLSSDSVIKAQFNALENPH